MALSSVSFKNGYAFLKRDQHIRLVRFQGGAQGKLHFGFIADKEQGCAKNTCGEGKVVNGKRMLIVIEQCQLSIDNAILVLKLLEREQGHRGVEAT